MCFTGISGNSSPRILALCWVSECQYVVLTSIFDEAMRDFVVERLGVMIAKKVVEVKGKKVGGSALARETRCHRERDTSQCNEVFV